MDSLETLTLKQRDFFRSGGTLPLGARRSALRKLQSLLEKEGDLIAEAIKRDLGRCWMEAWGSEPGIALADVRYALRKISGWHRRKRERLSPLMIPGKGTTFRMPYGTAVIIGPWNYPAGLLLAPMVSAIAAGNTVILKPSERAPHTGEVLQSLISRYFDEAIAAVAMGGGEQAQWLIRNAADIVCFTGSVPTGRKVMADAASRPVPVILELGGANPCYVRRDADITSTAKRIAWGKFFAAGQTCLAPNHVFVHREIEEDFLNAMKSTVKAFYGESPENSPDYGRIVDTTAWERLQPMLKAGKPVTGGYGCRDDLFVAPTVLTDVPGDSPMLRNEIFGPILPVVPYDSFRDALALCGSGDHSPLAAYGFSRNASGTMDAMKAAVRTGSITVNGTLHRIVSSSIGFGGVGGSGYGRYRGRAGYRNFTWERFTLEKNSSIEMPMIYPPYNIGRRLVRMLGKLF